MIKVEDAIIAYLDGTLDERSSEELLHLLSVSPEKRALMEEHLKMREMISLGQKPISVPLSLEQQLAERLPVLGREVPYLTPITPSIVSTSASETGVLFGITRFVSSLVSRSVLRTGLALTSAALVGGLSWYLLSQNTSSTPSGTFSAVGSQRSNTIQPSPDRLAANGSSVNTPSANGSESSLRFGLKESGPAAELSGHVADNVLRQQSSSLKSDAVSFRSIVMNSRSVVNPSLQNTSIANDRRENTQSTIADNLSDQKVPSQSESINNTENTISFASPRTSKIQTVSESSLHSSKLTIQREEDRVYTVFVRGAGSVNTSIITSPNYSGPTPTTATYTMGNFTGGVDWQITPHVAASIEVGRATFSQLTSSYTLDSIFSSSFRVTQISNTEKIAATWSRVLARYTFNPGEKITFNLNAGGGAAFTSNGAQPTVAGGLSVDYQAFERVGVFMNGEFSETWVTSQASTENWRTVVDSKAQDVTAAGVIYQGVETKTLRTPAFDVELGVRVGLW